MKIFLRYFLPAALVAGFLCSLFYELTHYKLSLDDCFFDGSIRKIGFWNTYALCYEVANGRWFGNLVACIYFFLAGHNFLIYAFILWFQAFLFIFAASFLYKNYRQTFTHIKITRRAALVYGLIFTSVLYFLTYGGRQEIWAWLDSATVHLLSVTFCMLLFGMLLKPNKDLAFRILLFVLAFCIGGMNEVNALCSLLLVAALLLFGKALAPISFNKFNFLLTASAVSLSLFINLRSDGYTARMNGLPDFTLFQSLKNTLHTFLLPVLQIELIPLLVIASLVIALLLQIRFHREKYAPILSKKEISVFALTFSIVSFSFFMHCYTLSDTAPARGAFWAYTLLLFVISLKLTKKGIIF